MTTAAKTMSVDQAREFLDRRAPGDHTLLDVRQDWEYEEFHLPGAHHVPLADLLDRLDEIDRDKPVLVYCLSGGRSHAAAALLDGQGYADVANMAGGIMAWQGHTAFGPAELGMVEFTGRETPQEVVLKAYAMENILQEFYILRADVAETLERIELFMELAGFEDRHKDTLFALYQKILGEKMDRKLFEEVALTGGVTAAEGGVGILEYLDVFGEAFDADQGVLQFASMIEAQALDYYLRCGMRAERTDARDVFATLAREEKAHLKLLARFMDRRGE
jgi:rhodanese-related sulfurtransferase/rubrerythrin